MILRGQATALFLCACFTPGVIPDLMHFKHKGDQVLLILLRYFRTRQVSVSLNQNFNPTLSTQLLSLKFSNFIVTILTPPGN